MVTTVSFKLIVGFCKIIAFCLKIIVMPQDFSIRILRKNHTLAQNLVFPVPSAIQPGKIVNQFRNDGILSQINCNVWFRETILWSGKSSRLPTVPLQKNARSRRRKTILGKHSCMTTTTSWMIIDMFGSACFDPEEGIWKDEPDTTDDKGTMNISMRSEVGCVWRWRSTNMSPSSKSERFELRQRHVLCICLVQRKR